MRYDIMAAGSGGQGIITLGKLFSDTALLQNNETTLMKSYGAEMRGGKANVQVIVSDEKIASPFIEEPDILVVFNELSYNAYKKLTTTKTVILYNSSLFRIDDNNAVAVPLQEIVSKTKNARGLNIAMFGAFCASFDFLNAESAKQAIRDNFEKKGTEIVEKNIRTFESGYDFVKTMRK